jgi:PST family polysaccharide transporter
MQAIRQVLQVISVSVLARHVPPAAYGLLAMAAVVTGMLETIRDLGLGQALIREREISDELLSTIFWINIVQGGAISVLVALAAYPTSFFFHEPLIVPILRVLAIAFFLGAVSVVPTAMLTRAMEFRKLAIIQTIAGVSGTCSAIGIALAGGQVWSLVSGSIAIAAVTAIGVWIAHPIHIRFEIRHQDIGRFLSFRANLSGFHVLNYFSRNTDNLLVGRFLGPSALGFYQMGYTLMTYPLQNLALMVSQVVYPAISSFHDDHARFRTAYVRSSSLIALITVPLMLGLMITAVPFVRVFFGDRWLPVAGLLAVFAPLGAMQSIVAPVGLIFESQARTDLRFRWMMFASVCYVASFVVGLHWGFMGVGVSYTIVWTLLMPASLLSPFRLIGLSGRVFLKALWPTIWMSLVMAACTWSWRIACHFMGITNPLVDLLSSAALGFVVYVALVVTYKPPVVQDLVAAFDCSVISRIRDVLTIRKQNLAGAFRSLFRTISVSPSS